MNKYRKTKKLFSCKEALSVIENCETSISTSLEAIASWQLNEPTGMIAYIIATEFGNLENAINAERNKIQYYKDKIEDYKRFILKDIT